jgi:hypothetical protein
MFLEAKGLKLVDPAKIAHAIGAGIANRRPNQMATDHAVDPPFAKDILQANGLLGRSARAAAGSSCRQRE